MRRFHLLAVIFVLLAPLQTLAVQPDEILKDTALEQRARTLSKELRCMVCQNQSIDDSDAPLARDLRILVRERLTAGDNDRAVLDFLVARYGEFVLLRPPLAWRTALLWLLPVIAILIGVLALFAAWRRQKDALPRPETTIPLTPAERARLAKLTKRADS